MKDYELIVVIPIYNETPSKTEKASLEQFSKAYDWRYDVRLICPEHFSEDTVNLYIKLLNSPENTYVQYKRYDDRYFASPETYSQLLKTNTFYIDCSDYEYMLIFQTDCWALNLSRLHSWCQRDFDYIGAPIMTNRLHWPSSPCCGNGGLSLRKISSFIKYTSNSRLIEKLNMNDIYRKYEDVFYCEGMSRYIYIDMPTWTECAEFAWDMNPDILYERNLELPQIGIHAWDKNVPFWKDILNIDEETYSAACKDNSEFIHAYFNV